MLYNIILFSWDLPVGFSKFHVCGLYLDGVFVCTTTMRCCDVLYMRIIIYYSIIFGHKLMHTDAHDTHVVIFGRLKSND